MGEATTSRRVTDVPFRGLPQVRELWGDVGL